MCLSYFPSLVCLCVLSLLGFVSWFLFLCFCQFLTLQSHLSASLSLFPRASLSHDFRVWLSGPLGLSLRFPHLGWNSSPCSGLWGLCSELGCGDGLWGLTGPRATEAGEAQPLLALWRSADTEPPSLCAALDQPWEASLAPSVRRLRPVIDRSPRRESLRGVELALLSPKALLESGRQGRRVQVYSLHPGPRRLKSLQWAELSCRLTW